MIEKNRKGKNILYHNEQNEIYQKINNILNVTNNYFIIENDNYEIKILNMINDIKKYFVYNRWSYFNNNNSSYLNLIKSIYNVMNYDIFFKKLNINNKIIIFGYIQIQQK